MSCDLKLGDLLELSKVYAPEYNMPELHDRVLVFDVMQDGWETHAILASSKHRDDSANVEENSGESLVTTSNEAQTTDINGESSLNEGKAVESKTGIKAEIKQDVETGSTSGQDSGTENELNIDSATVIVNDESPLVRCSTTLTDKHVCLEEGILRQHKIFVHSSWLAVQSKYFRSLFYSGMKETSSKEVHVKVAEFEEATHLMLVEAIYKADILNDASVDELLAVLELADKYDVKFVFKKCKYVLQTRVKTLDTCKQVMHVIKEKHSFEDVEDLAETMQATMGQNFTPLENNWPTERFTSQSQPFVQYLLASSSLQTGCENTVFQSLMHWMEVNDVDPEGLEKDCGLLKAVRFEKLTIDYLYNVVRIHPIASKMPGFQDLMLQGMTYHALSPELKQRLVTEVTPRQRQILNASTPQFTWKISQTQLLTFNSTPVKSEEFWLSGYKAYMQVQFYSGNLSTNNYQVNLSLNLLELTSKSYVPLKWRWTGDNNCFPQVVTNYIFTNTGTFKAYSININRPRVRETTSIMITVEEPQ